MTAERSWAVAALDRLISTISPRAGVRRAQARQVLSYYEAAKPTRLRKRHRDNGASPKEIVERSAVALREEARFHDRNTDMVRGIMTTMTNNIVGPAGIGIEPQPRRRDGTIHEEYRASLVEAYRDFCQRPEVTWKFHMAAAQRALVRTWVRDGEGFGQMISGVRRDIDHGTRVPLSLELIEPDFLPMDLLDESAGIRQAIETNGWGRPRGYWVYKKHPGDARTLNALSDMKRIDAANMLHLFTADRIGQLRGVSHLAAVLNRLADVRDYEESERIAAKIAASLTAFIEKNDTVAAEQPAVGADGKVPPREFSMAPGMIFDDLRPGERIGLIDSKRPNPNVATFRQGQLRMVAAGVGASYSSISRDYDGTYSAQRQELVEQWVHYATLTDEFTGQVMAPLWRRFVAIADLAGVVPAPRDINPDTMDDALFIGQSMPWIDPLKEAEAWVALVKAGFASEVEAIRRRGGSPQDVLDQLVAFRKKVAEKNLVLSSNAANDKPAAPQDPAAADPQPDPGRTRSRAGAALVAIG